jgi:hypothetical protein
MFSICQDLNIATIRACGHASWERRRPSFSQALLNGAICNSMSIPILFITVEYYYACYKDHVLQRFLSVLTCSFRLGEIVLE